MTKRGPGRPRNEDRPDRIADITRAAIDIFGEQGYASATFGAVARSAGITPAALYRYFEDKASLYMHAARVARDRTWTAISDEFVPSDSIEEDFAELLRLVGALRGPSTVSGLRLLASLQATAVHHDELRSLLEERWKIRHTVVGDIGRRAYERREVTSFDSAEDAASAVSLVFSGWALEAYATPANRVMLGAIAVRTVGALAHVRADVD